jgi:hypothetical protein
MSSQNDLADITNLSNKGYLIALTVLMKHAREENGSSDRIQKAVTAKILEKKR